jgi:OHCU decarboxylase
MSRSLASRPSALPKPVFVTAYGGIYEHSPWVAEGAWAAVEAGRAETPEAMAAAMAAVVDAAPREQQLALIRAHPELAGRAAIAGDMAEASKREQSGAGLDQCSREEFDAFQRLNGAYNSKFGFPFIIAVKGLGRTDILDAFERRLHNDPETEFTEALTQIHRIAAFRLSALMDHDPQ